MASKKEAFLEQAPRFGFIHLGITANESELTFSNEKMPFDELEGMELNAALVLMPHLSAPSSSIVEMAFLQAGAGSIISSLWNVSEESESGELLKYFYENLQKGLSKDEALRRARMEYLEKMPEDKLALIYWGQYRQVGDFRSISISEPISYIWWYLLPIVGLLGIGWWAMGALRQRR
jgi:CHAT domain-containing protein